MKGREWDRVIVFGASRGLFPHRLSDNEEEERRIFHVAITRACVEVVVVGDADAPSPFLGELDGSRPRRPLTAGASAVHNVAVSCCVRVAISSPLAGSWPKAGGRPRLGTNQAGTGTPYLAARDCLTRQGAGLCRVQ